MTQKRIAIMANAGGTGKTTLAVNLANELSQMGFSVCLVGLDPNGSLAMFLGIPNPGDPKLGLGAVLNNNFTGNWPLFECWSGRGKKVDAILSGQDLSEVVERLSTADRKTEALKDRLEDYPLPHDVILFDCPGTVDLTHKLALSACSQVLIPIQPDAKGVLAVATLLGWFYDTIKNLRLRPEPQIAGVVPNKVQSTSQHQQFLGLKPSASGVPSLPELLNSQRIPVYPVLKEFADISKAAMGGLPLRSFRPKHQANAVFREIAKDLIK